MIQIARSKGVREAIIADALQLPFAAESFDCVTIAFGLRNIADWGSALREMARVLVSGGHVLVLDFSIPKVDSARALSILFAPILANAGRPADGRKRGV